MTSTETTSAEGIVDEIIALEDQRWQAQIGEDLETLGRLYADELRYTHSNGVLDTKETYIAAIGSKKFDYQTADRTDTDVQVVGDTAVVTGRAKIGVIAGGREIALDARYTVTWVRIGGAWRFLTWQSTPLAS
jgi:ketosteroid isomerase-like protein